MRRRDFREKKMPLVMIIPMIDIMLFLLVFFMLSTIYMVQTNALSVNLPQSSAANQETRPNVLPITVTASGQILFDKETVTKKNLAEKIHTALAQDKETIFVLRGDKAARYESVTAVLDLLKKSGVRKISLATDITRT